MSILFQPWTLTIALACISACFAEELKPKFEWKYIDYEWEDDAQKKDAIDKGVYDYKNIVPTDFQPLPGGEWLIATPRFQNNPASLSIITNKTGDGGPLLAPFPDWNWHKSGDCFDTITSVSKLFLDEQNRLWFVDSGKIGSDQVCPPRILEFDVRTRQVLRDIKIPSELIHNPEDKTKGRLEIGAVEFKRYSVWVYIMDVEGYGLIIWDGTSTWRLDDDILHPTAEGEKFTINGDNFTLSEGPNALLLTPSGFFNQTYMIMKVLSSFETYLIPTDQLHESKRGKGVDIYRANNNANTQEPANAFTKSNGILISSSNTQTALACWNIQNPLTSDNNVILVKDDEKLQFVPSIKITQEGDGEVEKVSALSNRVQKLLLGTVNFDEINFRIVQADINKLVAGTLCEPASHKIVNDLEEENFSFHKTIYKS